MHGGLEDVLPIGAEPIDADVVEATELPPYTPDDYLGDMLRLTQDRCDPELVGLLVDDSREMVGWLPRRACACA